MNNTTKLSNSAVNSDSVFEYKKLIRNKSSALYIGAFFIFLLSLEFSLLRKLNLEVGVYIFLLFTFILYLVLKSYQASKESLLLVSLIGIQTSTTYCLGNTATKYIPWNTIQDVIINETISGFRVIFYLAVLVKNGSSIELCPLLLNSKLKLSELKEIYNKIQNILTP